MTKFGSIGSAEPLAHEQIVDQYFGYDFSANQSLNFAVAYYTMPMTGILTASINVGIWINGNIQEVSGVLDLSTPAPRAGFGFLVSGWGNPDSYVIGTMLNIWSPIAVGTTVTVNFKVSVGIYAPIIRVLGVSGFLRSVKQ